MAFSASSNRTRFDLTCARSWWKSANVLLQFLRKSRSTGEAKRERARTRVGVARGPAARSAAIAHASLKTFWSLSLPESAARETCTRIRVTCLCLFRRRPVPGSPAFVHSESPAILLAVPRRVEVARVDIRRVGSRSIVRREVSVGPVSARPYRYSTASPRDFSLSSYHEASRRPACALVCSVCLI